MKIKIIKTIYICALLALVITAVCLFASEDFDSIPPLEGDGNYLLHTSPLIPRESPGMFIAEDGKLFIFYIDSELVNVYTVLGDYLYGIQFPDGQNGKSEILDKDGLLYVDARTSGIYVFQETKLLRFEEQNIYNDGYDELKQVFSGIEDHKDGEYAYFYVEETNKIMRRNNTESETVLQFPQKIYDPLLFLWLILLMLYVGKFIWRRPQSNI